MSKHNHTKFIGSCLSSLQSSTGFCICRPGTRRCVEGSLRIAVACEFWKVSPVLGAGLPSRGCVGYKWKGAARALCCPAPRDSAAAQNQPRGAPSCDQVQTCLVGFTSAAPDLLCLCRGDRSPKNDTSLKSSSYDTTGKM